MIGGASTTGSAVKASWPNARLIAECIKGNEAAWEALIDKYKNLIFSIPVRRGFSRDDASDIFQNVAARLLSELTRIREPEALAAWLIQVTMNECTHWHKHQSGHSGTWPAEPAFRVDRKMGAEETPESLLVNAMREQALREAMHHASTQCRQLIQLLFFENSPLPYRDVAASLGIAVGSVGFVRRKCLDRLRQRLERAGFR